MSEISLAYTSSLEAIPEEYNFVYSGSGYYDETTGETYDYTYYFSPIPNTFTGSYYDPDVTWVSNMVFYNIPGLTSVDLPNLGGMGSGVFSGSVNLTSVNLPKVQWLNPGTFTGCTSLSTINLSGLSTNTALGGTPLNQEPLEGIADSGSITVPSYFATLNDGFPAEGLEYLASKGFSITYV